MFKNLIKIFVNRLKCFKEIEMNLENLTKKLSKKGKLFNSYTIIYTSFIISIICFFILFNYSKLIISSILFSVIILFFPLTIIEIVVNFIDSKIKKEFILLIINLQSFSKSTNNIILGFKEIKIHGYIKRYIDNFNTLISSGFSIGQAFDNLIKEINIREIGNIIYLLKLNYINGGDSYEILKESHNYLFEMEKIKQNVIEKKFNILAIFMVILAINIFFLVFFVLKNNEYKEILLNTFFGKIILDFNSFIYFLAYFYLKKLIKE